MLRPCFLVIDREYSGSISTRKLVIETAKFNVITSYSASEAIATLEKFPRMDGIVVDAGLRDMACPELVRMLRGIRPDIPIVAICPSGAVNCDGADVQLETFDPKQLLAALQKIVPEATKEIDEHEKYLASGGQ